MKTIYIQNTLDFFDGNDEYIDITERLREAMVENRAIIKDIKNDNLDIVYLIIDEDEESV
jgi:hypothetical protein